MPAEHYGYLVVVVMMVAAVAFALTPVALAYVWSKTFSPRKPGPDKNATYECGLESKGDAWVRFKAEYYLYAIIFLIFDVETIFLLPFAVAFTGLGVRRVRGDDGVSAVARGGAGVGLAERDFEMGLNRQRSFARSHG